MTQEGDIILLYIVLPKESSSSRDPLSRKSLDEIQNRHYYQQLVDVQKLDFS
jgi:hypothetical protein